MKRERWLQVRMGDEEMAKLRQLFEYYRVPSMSALVRLLIEFAYEERRYLEYYIESRED